MSAVRLAGAATSRFFESWTCLDLDDDLVSEAMHRYGLPTKRSAVEFALRRLVGDSMTPGRGLGDGRHRLEADLEELRAGGPAAFE